MSVAFVLPLVAPHCQRSVRAGSVPGRRRDRLLSRGRLGLASFHAPPEAAIALRVGDRLVLLDTALAARPRGAPPMPCRP